MGRRRVRPPTTTRRRTLAEFARAVRGAPPTTESELIITAAARTRAARRRPRVRVVVVPSGVSPDDVELTSYAADGEGGLVFAFVIVVAVRGDDTTAAVAGAIQDCLARAADDGSLEDAVHSEAEDAGVDALEVNERRNFEGRAATELQGCRSERGPGSRPFECRAFGWRRMSHALARVEREGGL